MQTAQDSIPQSKLLVIDREFNVPVDRLFNAFTTSDSLKAWWWPRGFYSDRIDLDFRVGGKYFISMKGFDRGGGGMTGWFDQIVKNRRIVMSDQFADEDGKPISAHEARMPGNWPEMIYITFDFDSFHESTSSLKLIQQGIPTEAQEDCIRGWSEMFDKLEKYFSMR